MPNLNDIIGDSLSNTLQHLLSGTRQDIHDYAYAVAARIQQAMTEPDQARREALLKELRDQVRMIGELQRLRATQATWEVVGTLVDGAFAIGFAALGVPPTSPEE